jgi:hypothetical protein
MDLTEQMREHEYLRDTDPESYDELLYDNSAMDRGMTDILNTTRIDPRFMELYVLAAGKLISMDPETGLCILLTYDYFADFIRFYENPTDKHFICIKNKLS